MSQTTVTTADHHLDPILRDTPWGRSITQAAINADVSPEVLLFRVLQLILSHVGPHVVLPPIVGSFGSLNLLTLMVGPSAAGKSSLDAAAEEVINIKPIYDRAGDAAPWQLEFEPKTISGLTSGQSLAAAVQTKVTGVKNRDTGDTERVSEQPCDRVSVTIADGSSFINASSSRGSILKETIATAGEGGYLTTWSARGKNHDVPDRSYSAQVSIFVQDASVAPLFEMDGLRIARRLLFASAQPDIYIDAPIAPITPVTVEVPVYWMKKLDRTSAPRLGFGAREYADIRRTIKVAKEVSDEVRLNRQVSGCRNYKGNPLDAHMDFMRLKVSVPLALLTGELSITPEVWELAGHIINYSTAERDRLMKQSAGMAEAAAVEKVARRIDRQKPRVMALVKSGGSNGVSSKVINASKHGVSGHKRADGSTARGDMMLALDALVEEGAVIYQDYRYYDAAYAR
ncbi:hypothetical protein ACTXK0_05165 [Corynebacterium variabile]|uniref:hypothetical protein n=1 Tax=Corynebacterium variabile TaxID=1727 RepID=UPI003FD243A2